MKKLLRFFVHFFLMLSFFSCANYINKMHREFDRADKKHVKKPKYDKFDMYRRRPVRRRRYSTSNMSRLNPSVKRKYREVKEQRRRYSSDDLYDNGPDGSIWVQEKERDNLFTTADRKISGDIVLINVFDKLKNEITAELKRAFPPKKKNKKKKDDEQKGKAPASTTPAKPEKEKEINGIKDRISTIVVEEINDKHLLIRGRKYLLYKKRKRKIEIQALISRKDINPNDEIDSDKILESNVAVVR